MSVIFAIDSTYRVGHFISNINCYVVVDAFYASNYSTFFRGSLHRTECSTCGKYPLDCFVLETFREYRDDLRDHGR